MSAVFSRSISPMFAGGVLMSMTVMRENGVLISACGQHHNILKR